MKDKVRFSIPEPCHESWAEMNPVEQGRFCDKCCKIVFDFTSKTTKEILDFIKTAANKNICATATEEQLSLVPVKVATKRTGLFFAAIYLVFGSLLFTACHSKKHSEVKSYGKFIVEPASSTKAPAHKIVTPDKK
jgi:hypothetical protein